MKNKLLIGLLLVAQVNGVLTKGEGMGGHDSYNPAWRKELATIKAAGRTYQELKADYEAYRNAQVDPFAVQIGVNNECVANAKKALQKDPSNKKLQMGLAIAQEEQGAYLSWIQDMPAPTIYSFEGWLNRRMVKSR